MFNISNIFGNKNNKNDNNDYSDNLDKSPNYAQRISLNSIEKKFSLEGLVGNFYVKSVYDGDTFNVIVPSQIHFYNMIDKDKIDEKSDTNKNNEIFFNNIKVRLYGIDTPEMKPSKNLVNREEHIKKAIEAKDYLSNLILNKIIKVEFLANDKYGRPLAKIYNEENKCINDLIVEQGYAKFYDGKTKDTDF